MSGIELKPCPFCGRENKVWIGVHDYESNYHGPIGCEYESDPWSGLEYALHHDSDYCLLSTDGDDECMGNLLFSTPEEAAEAWNTRYEPTCHAVGRDLKPYEPDPEHCLLDAACDQCGGYLGGRDQSHVGEYCRDCGAKVVER